MEEKITIELKMAGFATVSDAVDFAHEYEEMYKKIPVDKWVRCSEVDHDRYCLVAKLFKMLCRIGLAEKRIVDDGIVYVTDTRWVWDFEEKVPKYITAYDKDGNSLGEVLNPKFRDMLSRRGDNGKWVEYQRPIHANHSEYRLLP